jgi:molybdate/tungstate transport system ATP-binding protein
MISLVQIAVRQGAFVLQNVTLEVPTGAYGVLMGRTGSGKTTILETICGLRPVGAGRVRLMGRDVTGQKPAARGVGYVPQDMALFSTLTVRDHLAFSLVVRRWSRTAINARVAQLAELLGIGHLLDRKPHGLSGGESQRVALGRALATEPEILLFDEPLSALDDNTRNEMYELLHAVRRQATFTVLHVTHNRAEADVLADRLYQICEGTIHDMSDDLAKTPEKGTGPCFRPTIYPQNASISRKMDQSPTNQ